MKTPNLEEIREYFKDAKTIVCLKTKMEINVSAVKLFFYRQKTNAWTSIGGTVYFWRNGKYSRIKTTKSGNPLPKKCTCSVCRCKGKPRKPLNITTL